MNDDYTSDVVNLHLLPGKKKKKQNNYLLVFSLYRKTNIIKIKNQYLVEQNKKKKFIVYK